MKTRCETKRCDFRARTMLVSATLTYCAATGSLSACTPDDGASTTAVAVPDADVVYQTEYLDIAPLSDAPICAGTLAMVDDYIDYLRETLNLYVSQRVTVYLSREGELDLKEWCHSPERVGGCYTRGVTFTSMYGLFHELVHWVTDGPGLSWWGEGAAHGFAFRRDYSTPDFSAGWTPLRGESGHLSRWLIERFGGDTYMELYAKTPKGADHDAVDSASRGVLGRGIDDLLSEYAKTAPFVYPDYLACYVSPDAIEAPWVADAWAYELTLDCGQTTTFSGGDGDEQRMYGRIPVELPTDGHYRFIADRPDAELKIQPCLAEPSVDPIPSAEDWPVSYDIAASAPYLLAGRHVLLVSLPPGSAAVVRLKGFPEIAEHDVP